jgi:hypothetical protein
MNFAAARVFNEPSCSIVWPYMNETMVLRSIMLITYFHYFAADQLRGFFERQAKLFREERQAAALQFA